MSVYAPVPAYVGHNRHLRALFLIIVGHALVIGAVMTAKMALPPRTYSPIQVDLIPEQIPPPENQPPRRQHQQLHSQVDQAVTVLPTAESVILEANPTSMPPFNPGLVSDFGPVADGTTRAEPVRTQPRFITPGPDIKPPYPQSKLVFGEEAVLHLKLSIDARGRVTAVEPVGAVDPVFLAAARKHLIAHWRYWPASEDGRPVATSTTITLRFQLDS